MNTAFLLLALLGVGQAQPVSAPVYQKRILVILDLQKVYAFEGDKLVFELKCSTGRKGLETPISTGEPYKVTAKIPVGKALPELGGATLHWQMRVPMYDPKQKRVRRIGFHAYHDVPDFPASSGCIRLKKPDAKKLFDWAEVGVPVWVHETVPIC